MAASIPHHYSFDYSLPTEYFCNLPVCEETPHVFNNNGLISAAPFSNYDPNSPVSVGSFPADQFMVVPQMSEVETGFRDFSVCDYQHHHQVFEPGEDCSGLVPNFWAFSPLAAENWATQRKPVTKVEETEMKVGRYSVEERKDRILRYLKKRNQRNFNKTIKYACRKTLADKRVRVRGRFAKNNEPSEEEIVMNTNHQTCYDEQSNSFYDDSLNFQMKYEEDYWLQAATDSLVQLLNYS